MDLSPRNMTGFPMSILFAIIATSFLFVSLPLMTQLQGTPDIRPATNPILIDTNRPAPPPPENRDEPEAQAMPEQKIIENKDRPRASQPKIDISRGGLADGDIVVDVEMPGVPTAPVLDPVYIPGEVDQAPRLLRSFPLRYPYLAKRDNIEGWVMLRFVVDAEGVAGQIEVVSADPEGIFEEAALKAVARYKFKPAVKNGEAVNCIVKQRIYFSLD